MQGRHARAVIGTVVIVVDVLAFAASRLLAQPYSWQEIAAHVVFGVLGLLLVDVKSGMEVLSKVAAKAPWRKGSE